MPQLCTSLFYNDDDKSFENFMNLIQYIFIIFTQTSPFNSSQIHPQLLTPPNFMPSSSFLITHQLQFVLFRYFCGAISRVWTP